MTRMVSRTLQRSMVVAALAAAVGTAERAPAANKARAELVSSTTAVAPSHPFDVALVFTLDEHWHLYWKNAGDAGIPPKAAWKLPPGFVAGELRFPLPKRVTQSGIVTNLLEDKPVLLATITPPPNLPAGRTVNISADLSWLACAEKCLNERQSVSMSLPTVGQATDVKSANEKLFRRALKKLPLKRGTSKFVTVSPSLGSGTLAPGAMFEVHLDVVIKRGFHIQSNKPLIAGLKATDVFMNPIEDLFYDPPIFPNPKVRVVKGVGKLSEFDGEIEIRIPVEADTELPGASRKIGGVLVYQACNEKGMCFPKEGVEWEIDIPLGQAAIQHDAGDTSGESRPAPSPPEDVKVAGGTASVEPPSTSGAIPATTDAENTAADDDGPGGLEAFLSKLGLPGLLFGCFLFGLSINATPCVLPLLSIKVLGFVQQAHESRRRSLMLGLAFGVGVTLFFVVLGFLAASGKNILQYPVGVIALGTIVMVLALSMLGVYTLQAPAAANRLEGRIQREGLASSFGKGALAPVLGFACTGPLLASAFAWATKQPPHIAVVAFMFAGAGMASPYVLLGANPNWLSFLPKPGQWMITFERVMGFILLGVVVYLLHPLVTLLGPEGLEWTLGFLVAVAMGCWVLGKVQITMPPAQQWRYRGGAASIVLVSGFLIYGWAFSLGEAHERMRQAQSSHYVSNDDWSQGIPWRKWTAADVRAAVESGKTVFVDFTSASCSNCKINKARATNTEEVRAKMKALGVVPFKADFTFEDPEIAAELQKFGQVGVPLNLLYPPGNPDHPIKFKTLFGKEYFLEKLDAVGPSNGALASAGTH